MAQQKKKTLSINDNLNVNYSVFCIDLELLIDQLFYELPIDPIHVNCLESICNIWLKIFFWVKAESYFLIIWDLGLRLKLDN